MTETVWLQRPGEDVPWGFRLQGGRDYQTPLNVQKVTPGSVAATGLAQGDVILRIGDTDTYSLTYTQAMDVIKSCGNLLQLSVSKRGGGSQATQVEASDSSSNMASDALHDLFSDMYRYGDSPYGQQGAYTQPQAPSSHPSYSTPSYSSRGQDYGSGVHASHGSPGFDQYGRQGSRDHYYGGPGSGVPTQAPAPPTYNDVQIHRDQQPTRLEQQLSNMSVGSDYGRQNSYPYQAPAPQTYSPSHPPGAPAPYGQTYSPGSPAQYSPASQPQYAPTSPSQQPQPRQQPTMPDAVLNMAARGEPDKKPWAYAPDMDSIKEQRDKVRRRAPGGGMPKYQQLLNLPNFEDPPKPRGHGLAPQTPTSPPAPGTPDYSSGPGDASVAHLQYNSPLQMYSENNATEAFMGQTDGVVTGVSGIKKDGGQDITQSPVYRMIHGMDGDNRRPRPVTNVPIQEGHRVPKSPAVDDELSFSGVNNRTDIPSKSFHRLQNMTGSSDVDTSSIRANVTGEDDIIGGYDQASIRYTGRNIPSKSFRMLQSMTGVDPIPEHTAPQHTRRQRPKPEPQSPEQNPDDIVDISYVGGNIPSRSFQMLQHAVGGPQSDTDEAVGEENGDTAYDDMYYMGEGIPSRSFQLLQGAVGPEMDKHALATEHRRRRRNEVIQEINEAEEEMFPKDDFDENAYLTGQIPLNVSGTGEKPKRNLREPTDTRQVASWQSTVDEQPPEGTTEEEDYFDEDAYLSGQISILGNKPKTPVKSPTSLPTLITYEPEEQETQRQFDEDAYLAGRLPLWDGDSTNQPRQTNKQIIKEEEPDWVKQRQQKATKLPEIDDANNNEQFDENKFLGRQITEEGRQYEEGVETRPFDEEAYLTGVPFLDSKTNVPPRDAQKPKVYRDRAPWERDDQSQQDFDEEKYLLGRVPTTVRTSVEREIPTSNNAVSNSDDQFAAIPSRTFHYLRRSVSRDQSPPPEYSPSRSSGCDSAGEDDHDPNKAYSDMMYVGKKIPSKTFLRLKKSVASREQRARKGAIDPIDHLKENMEDDIDMDNLQIDTHDPNQYMEKLKETIQANNNIKIEAISGEVTDF